MSLKETGLERLVRSLPPRPAAAELVAQFVAPPRFADASLDGYHPDQDHPSQAEALQRVRELVGRMRPSGWAGRLRAVFQDAPRAGGIYLDGDFGVGKTHLLAGTWHAAPGPKAYLSFDELAYAVGLFGVVGAREAFAGQRLVAVDDWDLDEPGNLQLALAFVRGALGEGTQLIATARSVPSALVEGDLPQRSFLAELDDMAPAFEVLRIEGEDFRHRRFSASPGLDAFSSAEELSDRAADFSAGAVLTDFDALLDATRQVHPIRYGDLVSRLEGLFVRGVAPLRSLPHALRWVHLVDKLYDAAIPFAASGSAPLADLFPPQVRRGPHERRFARCLARMQEMLEQER